MCCGAATTTQTNKTNKTYIYDTNTHIYIESPNICFDDVSHIYICIYICIYIYIPWPFLVAVAMCMLVAVVVCIFMQKNGVAHRFPPSQRALHL